MLHIRKVLKRQNLDLDLLHAVFHRYTGLISRTLGRTVFLTLVGFILVFSSRLSAVD